MADGTDETPDLSLVEVGRQRLPAGYDMETVLGCGVLPDAPIDMGGWSKLVSEGNVSRLRRLCMMFESQDNCTTVVRHNGAAALQQVLEAVARACSLHRVPMSPRIRAVAEYYDLPVA